MEKRRLIIVVLGSSNKTKRLKSFSFEIENDAEIVDRYVDIQFIANDHREEFDIYWLFDALDYAFCFSIFKRKEITLVDRVT